MSVLAACLHKAEWICSGCGKCGGCCLCDQDGNYFNPVHINTKAAAEALAKWARERRQASLNLGK